MASQLAIKRLEKQAQDSYYSNFVPWQYCSDTRIPVRVYGNAKIRFTTKNEEEYHGRPSSTLHVWGPPEQDIVKLGVKNQRIAAAFLRLPNVASLRLFWMRSSVKPLLDCIAYAAKHDHYIELDELRKYRGVGLDVSTTLTIMKSRHGSDVERLHWLAVMPDDFQWTNENWEAFKQCCEPPIPKKHFAVWQLIGVIIPMVRRNPKQFPRSQSSLERRPPRVDDDDIVAAVVCIRSYLIAGSKSKRQDWITTCDKQPSQTIYFLRQDAQPSQYWLRGTPTYSRAIGVAKTLSELSTSGFNEICAAHFNACELTSADVALCTEACAILYTSKDNLFIDSTRTIRLQEDSLITIYKILIRRFDVRFRNLKGALVFDICGDVERCIRAFETLHQMAKITRERNARSGYKPALINVPDDVFQTWQMIWSSWFSEKIKLFTYLGDYPSIDCNSGFGGVALGPGTLLDELLMPTGRLHSSNPDANFSAILVKQAELPRLTLIGMSDYHSIQKEVKEKELTWTSAELSLPSEDLRLKYRTAQTCLGALHRITMHTGKPDNTRDQLDYIGHGWTVPSSGLNKNRLSHIEEENSSLLEGYFGALVIDEAHLISSHRCGELQACTLLDASFNLVITSMPSESFTNGCLLFKRLLFRDTIGGGH